MGLFNFFKKNKNIITDNGTNYIYYDDGKGSIKEKFIKINGILNGDYIEYNRNGSFKIKTYIDGVIRSTEEEILKKNQNEKTIKNIDQPTNENALTAEEISKELDNAVKEVQQILGYNRGHRDISLESLPNDELFQENDVVDYEGKDAFRYLVIGTSKFEKGDYEGALDDYKKSIELNPKNARAYLEIGNAKLKLNDYKGAILDYSKSIELDSNHADSYHNRSIAKSKLGDYQGVIDDCTKTIEIDNNYTRAYFNRGTAYANLQEFMEAIGDMNSVIELDPNNSNAYKNRGICMYEFEQYDSALKDLNKAMELDPNSNAYTIIDKINEELLNIEVKSTNKIINTVETNYEFKNKIEGFIKNKKVKNFELIISISKWYGHTPFICSGEFEGYNFTAEIVEVCKWGTCEHNYKDINKLLNDIKNYEIEELHKFLDIDILSEDEDFEIEFIKWEEGTPDEFIEKIEEEWGALDVRDNSTKEEQLDFVCKDGAVIDGIRILLSNDDSSFELSWIYSKEKEEIEKYDDGYHIGYILCKISFEDEYELEDVTLFCIQVDFDDSNFGISGIIWISFDIEKNEPYRVIELPEDLDLEENIGGNYSLGSFNTFDEASNYIKNLKTISFDELKKQTDYPCNENLEYFRIKHSEN